jgi:transglutaminase-like putative cysteine protease
MIAGIPGCRLGALALFVAAPLRAQAPRITPAGDPSVRSDSIYALAVDSAAHRDEGYVLLLDDGVIKLERDGTARETYRQVVQLLTPEAAKAWAERTFGYAPERERFTLNWLRVIRPNGEVVSDKPSVLQESDVPASAEVPVYAKQRVLRASLSGVQPGVLIDWSTTKETVKPALRGDFASAWSTTTGVFTRRSRLLLDVPVGFEPRMREYNLPRPREETVKGGRKVYAWTAQDVPRPPRAEPFAADSNEFYAHIGLAAPMSWNDIAAWYAGLARGRDRITPALDAKLAELMRNARTLDDSVRAAHRWVAQDIRYVSIALGEGGYQPRAAAEVLTSGFGDCKDKATLLIGLLQRMGVKAYPVLLNSGEYVQTDPLPSITAFNHAIAMVVRSGGDTTYVDPTSEFTPYGELPPTDQGQFALVVLPDGKGKAVTLPAAPPSANLLRTSLLGTVDTTGLLRAQVSLTAAGAMQYGLRQTYAVRPDSATQAAMVRNLAVGLLPYAKSDSLQAFDGKDLQATPHISFATEGGKLLTLSGATAVMPVNVGGIAAANRLRDLLERGPRHYPIDARRVNPPLTFEHTFRVTLPPGWTARLPSDVHAAGIFGKYDVTYRQAGRELTIVRRNEGSAGGILPASRVDELTAWFRQLSADDATAIVIDLPPAQQAAKR